MTIASRHDRFSVTRLGEIMHPEPDQPQEAWGVLNPGGVRALDGTMHLFPRVIAEGNYSRIAHARVRFEDDRPVGVERLGIALEPQAPYEVTQGGGGVEDPRVVYVPLLKRFVMTYTAVVPNQAQIAVAVSDDLQTWTRLGVLVYARPARTWAEELTANKDGAFFPEPILDPHGVPSFAIIHRPTMRVHVQFGARQFIRPSPGLLAHEGVWISYVPDSTSQRGLTAFGVAMSNLSGDVIESSYEELGLVQTGTFAGRDLDTLGFAVNDQHFADTALDAIRAARVSAGGTPGIATHETMMELNYGVHVSSSVTIAPNLQYIVHPDQFAEPFFTGTIRNAFVIGLHVSVNLAPLLTAHR